MKDITSNILVPISTEEDARKTATVVDEYEYERITVVHVIEQTPGIPDPISPEQATEQATVALSAFRETIPDAETEQVFREDVIEGIMDVAADIGASSILFRPRGGSRITRFLSGDTTLRLVTEADRPVIAVPDGADERRSHERE